MHMKERNGQRLDRLVTVARHQPRAIGAENWNEIYKYAHKQSQYIFPNCTLLL